MTKISCTVIIPTYKNYNTIERAVNSILMQTVLPEKIIIIDDFSNEENYYTLLKKINQNALVEVIFLKENGGPGTARNKGMELAKTNFIAFLDSDDSWHPEKLEIQYQIMKNENYYLTCHETNNFDNKYESLNKNSIKVHPINKHKLFISNNISTRSVMMKNERKYFFKDKKRFSEDYLMWLEIVCNNEKVGYIPLELGYFYKETIFDEGLASNLKLMFIGELENISILEGKKKINSFESKILYLYFTVKYINRLRKKRKFKKRVNI